MQIEKQLSLLAQEIHKKLSSFVNDNKGDDDKFYQQACVRFNSRKTADCYFNGGMIEISGWKEDEDGEVVLDYELYIRKNTIDAERYGGEYEINLKCLGNYKREGFRYILCGLTPILYKLTDEQKNEVKILLGQIYEDLSSIRYDKEQTHSILNFTPEAKKQYYIQQFNNELEKLNETDSTMKILPSVEVAVDWWINELSKKYNIEENKLFKIKEILSKSIMNELSNGESEVEIYSPMNNYDKQICCLNSDYTILEKAILESGIENFWENGPINFNIKEMKVDINTVKLKDSRGNEILYSSIQEEVKPKSR